MEDRPNYFAIIPSNVRYDRDLKDKAKLLFGEISALSNKYGVCWANDEYFAKLYDVSERTVRSLLKNLKDKNYILIDYVYYQNTNEIDKRYISIVGMENIFQTCGKNLPRGVENFFLANIDNNTSINNSDENIFDFIQRKFGRMLSPCEFEVIRTWSYDLELLKLAVEEAINHGAKSIKYIDKILYDWEKSGVKTLDDAKKCIQEFNKKNGKGQNQSKNTSGIGYYKEL